MPNEVDCCLLIREGAAADVLLKAANREDDLLVVGASRHGRWWPFGRTVSRCASKAGCLVVVVARSALARSAPARKLVRQLHRELDELDRMGLGRMGLGRMGLGRMGLGRMGREAP